MRWPSPDGIMRGKDLERQGGLTHMRSRPLPVTVAAILLVLLALSDFPWLFDFVFLTLFPVGDVEGGPPAFILYSGYVLGIVSLVVAVGLWMLKAWSYWATIVV